jgi:hypothetical protein
MNVISYEVVRLPINRWIVPCINYIFGRRYSCSVILFPRHPYCSSLCNLWRYTCKVNLRGIYQDDILIKSLYLNSFVFFVCSFIHLTITFVTKVNYLFNTMLPCFWLCIAIENKWTTLAPTSGELNDHLRQENSASTFIMPTKKTATLGAVLTPLDTNQDGILLREAQI